MGFFSLISQIRLRYIKLISKSDKEAGFESVMGFLSLISQIRLRSINLISKSDKEADLSSVIRFLRAVNSHSDFFCFSQSEHV